MFVLSEPARGTEPWRPVSHLSYLLSWLILSAVAFALLAWPQRAEFARDWREAQARHNWRAALAVNLALFAALVPATMLVARQGNAAAPPAWELRLALTLTLAATAVSLLRLDLSLRSLFGLLYRYRAQVIPAGLVSGCALLLSLVTTSGWDAVDALARGTLWLSKGILELYESGVRVDPAERVLGVDGFGVKILHSCSGYEGLGLVAVFLSLYLWAFRRRLRFPHAFVLVPLGLGAIWVLNSVRIAALISLGAHVSPAIAVRGFHTQAGWIAFLAVTIAIMALAHRWSFVGSRPQASLQPQRARIDKSESNRLVLAFLAPFVALMLASMVLSASAPHDRPIYALKVAAVGIVLWIYRDIYRGWTWRIGPESLAAGALVGILWIATDPSPSGGSELRLWLASQGTMVAGLWLAMRVVGAVITVPIAEELAFRGFLHRWLISRNFQVVPIGQMSLLAFLVSSLLFGAMHERWIAGALSGAVFAAVMYRTNRLSDPIAAHMTANAIICAWAIAWPQWSLL